VGLFVVRYKYVGFVADDAYYFSWTRDAQDDSVGCVTTYSQPN
jgi:hypothetical protein